MITWEEVLENLELRIKQEEDPVGKRMFGHPWYHVFRNHPHLYREFSDRFDEMDGNDIAFALRDDLTLVLDLKEYLYRLDGRELGWLLKYLPEISLCLKYKDNPDKAEAAYYILFPHELDDLNKEEKRKIGRRIIELLKEEKI